MADLAKRVRRTVPELTPALSLRAVPFFQTDHDGDVARLLTDRQRATLHRISTRLRLPARMTIYQHHSPASYVFIVAEGAVKAYRELESGKRRVSAFLFARDLFGLAEQGRYVNTVQTMSTVTLYRLPIDLLKAELRHDGELAVQFLMKLTHELRQAQLQSITLGRKEAIGRLAMFIDMIERRLPRQKAKDVLMLPMSRTDIAEFVGLSLEAVSRSAAELERRGLIAFDGRRGLRILDGPRLKKLAGKT